jgi:hypothetical protein
MVVNRCDVQYQKMSKYIHRYMRLAALASFRPIVSPTLAALCTRLQCVAVKDGRATCLLARFGRPQQHLQVVNQRLEYACFQPPPGLLVHHRPRRQVGGHHALGCACADHTPESVEHFTQAIYAMRHICSHQGQIWRDKRSSSATSLGYGLRFIPSVYRFTSQKRITGPSGLVLPIFEEASSHDKPIIRS